MDSEEKSPSELEALVVVGSSAGGIEALSVLVGALPEDFPAPIILAQHLDPARPSNLHGILKRRTRLPVAIVGQADGDGDGSPLEPGHVYVVPSNRHVVIRDGRVQLEGDHVDRPRPSVDLLLSSAAESLGERLVAVILTGSGSDGASGAVDVKNVGGTVIIQNPRTARYPSMPSALPPTVVDYVLDLDRIGPVLHELVTTMLRVPRAGAPRDEIDDPLRDILATVNQQAKIDFRQYKPATILRRIGRRMAATHNPTMAGYARYLERHSEEVGELVKAFLINVTGFFRDPEAFAFLRSNILPQLADRGRERDRQLRIWSAGCATGEEAYSLALLVADHLGAELSEWNIRIFATDVDEDAVEFARRGVYPESVLRSLPDDFRGRYFERVDGGYRISKMLRQMVIFGQQDLVRGAPFPRIDLVVCRNLLIYFKPELQQHILNLFAYALQHTRGYLFLGHAETVRPPNTSFEQVSKKWKVYRCIAGMSAAGVHPTRGDAQGQLPARFRAPGKASRQLALPPIPAAKREGPAPTLEPAEMETQLAHLRRFNETVLRLLPVGVVTIDRAYRIYTASSVARRLLGILETGAEQDLLHAARGLPYPQVRSAIDGVFRDRVPVTLSDIRLDAGATGEVRFLTLNIALMPVEAAISSLAVIGVMDVTEEVRSRQRSAQADVEQKRLVEELQTANTRLVEMNKELQEANEELQATNEELVLSQEELHARTAELEELTKVLAGDRVRLAETVELAPFYIMVAKGPRLVIDAVNPRYEELMPGRELVGRPLEEVFQHPGMAEVLQAVHEAFQQDRILTSPRIVTRIDRENGAPTERYFVYTIVPTHGTDARVDGVVIYAEDVSEERAREARESRERLRLMVEHADQVALGLYDARTTELLHASPRYLDMLERTYGYARNSIVGRPWRELAFVTPAARAEEVFKSVVASGSPNRLRDIHLRSRRDDMEKVWDFTLTPISVAQEGEKDGITFVVLSAIEVTEQVEARQELQRLDRLKDEFLSLASHELRTPMVPLVGYADMIARLIARKEKANDPDLVRIDQYAQKFRGQLSHLNRLIDDLFDVARLESGKLPLRNERVDLVKVLREAVEQALMFDDRRNIRLELPDREQAFSPEERRVSEGRALHVIGDEGRLLQVVMNLLHNAIKHAPESERIDVRLSVRRPTTGEQPPAKGRKRAKDERSEPGEAEIQVQDYGPGIEAKDLASLFDRFFQGREPGATRRTAREGLGLGLYISRNLVEQQGGTLTAKSTVGEGSTFTIKLPLAT